jgi:hypothetical protein
MGSGAGVFATNFALSEDPREQTSVPLIALPVLDNPVVEEQELTRITSRIGIKLKMRGINISPENLQTSLFCVTD